MADLPAPLNVPVGSDVRWVDCPTCGARAPYHASNPWRPFCGARCRSRDLGAWASERYRLPADPSSADDSSAPLH